jgi:hypothetical protein
MSWELTSIWCYGQQWAAPPHLHGMLLN